jgi:hypothetical protein
MAKVITIDIVPNIANNIMDTIDFNFFNNIGVIKIFVMSVTIPIIKLYNQSSLDVLPISA